MASPRTARPDRMEAVQEGCRWLYNPPTSEQFSDWFKNNVVLHAGMTHEHYVSGIVVIPNKEKIRFTDSNGEIQEVERLSFSPYPQVETRIRYFWDWCRLNEYLGKITAVKSKEPSKRLPAEQFVMQVEEPGDKVTSFIGATYQIEVSERDPRGGTNPVMEPPPGTKMVPMRTRHGADVNAPMKAQTGAIGRALGYAGMLILPGSGVSSAEDMQEFTGTGPVEPTVPDTSTPAARTDVPEAQNGKPPADLMPKIAEMIAELESEWPTFYTQVEEWAKERGIDLEKPPEQSLTGLARMLARKLDSARRSAN